MVIAQQAELRVGKTRVAAVGAPRGRTPRMTGPVRVSATFYRDRNAGDLVGYMQALADALQKAGVLVDDRQIVSWGRHHDEQRR